MKVGQDLELIARHDESPAVIYWAVLKILEVDGKFESRNSKKQYHEVDM